tara:strand:- start:1796 stop:5641 length:3846 start_codon:yes stop_codon:yes gene_type:complete
MANKTELIELMRAADKAGDAESVKRLLDIYDRTPEQAENVPTPQPTQTEFTPEQIESAGFGDLAQTMRGFQQLEAPAGREFWGDYEHPLQSELVRPLAAGVSALPRGVLKGALAASEVAAGRPFAPELVELEQSWSDWERGLTKGAKPEDDDIYVVIDKAKKGDFSPIASLIGRGMVQAAPGMYAAIQNMPAYMGTLIGDYAERAAADRGSDSIEFNDLGRAISMAAGVGAIERASALRALGGGRATTVPGAAARGSVIEGGEEYTQQHLENIGIQAGSDRPGLLGVDWAEGHKKGLHGLAVGAPMGFGMGGGGAWARNRAAERQGAPAPEVQPDAAPTPEGFDAETEVAVVSPIVQEYLASRLSTPREQVEADTDVAVRRVDADRALAEEIAAVPTRPRTGEVEPRTTQAQAQAELDQADVDVDTTASDPSSSLADVVERQAHAAGLRSNANNASNADTRAFLEEIHPDDPGRVRQIMSQERVPVSQALAELQARDLHTRTPDDLTVKTTEPFEAMIDDIIATGRGADHVEKLAFGHAKVQHRRVYKNLLRQYGDAESQAARNALAEKINNIRESAERIAEANARAQNAWGLAGRYSQLFLDKDLTLIEAIAKAKVDNGGVDIDADMRAFIEKEYAASDALEGRAKPVRQAAIKKMRALSRVIRRIEGKASPTKRDAKLLKEAKKRYDRAEGVVIIADHDIRAAKSIRLNAIDRAATGRVLTAIGDIDDASRAIRSSGEDSSLGRQGMNLLARSLITKDQAWIRTIPPALKILAAAAANNPAGRARARRLQQELVDQPYQAVFDLAGGQLSEVEGVAGRNGGKLDARQEEFATNLFNRLGGFNVPLVGKVEVGRAVGERLIEPSQNAYSLTLNMLRRDYFDRALKKRLEFSNIPTDLSATELIKAVKADPQLLADLKSDAYLANVFTGRGDWRIGTAGDRKGNGPKDIAAHLAKRALYAPRYMMSIIENSMRTIPSAALTGLLTRRSWTKPLNYKNYPEWFKKLKDREYDPRTLPLLAAGVGPFKNVTDYQRGRLMGEAIFETAWLGSIAALAMIGFGDDDDEISWQERWRRFNDPGHADYRKIVIGPWHVSVEGGRGATTRHLMPYELTESETDGIADVSGDVDWSRRIGRLLRNKTRPLVSSVISAAANEDYLGNQVTDMEWDEAKENVHDLMTHLGQRSIPIALSFTPIIAESMGAALGEGMAETGIPGVVPPDPSMADPDAPSLLNRLLITGGTNMFGIGAQYYDTESGDANLPPELRSLLRSADPARLLRPPSVP